MTFEIIFHSLSYLEITMLILSMPQFHFELINQHFIPLKTKTSEFSSQQNCKPTVTTEFVIQLHALTDVKSRVYSSALPSRFMLWFNQSWNIIYYMKEIVLQQQGSESKKIDAEGLLSKERGKQWGTRYPQLLFADCWVSTEPFSSPALRVPSAHSSAPWNADLSHASCCAHKETCAALPLNSAIPTSGSSDAHIHVEVRPQDTTKALKDCIPQGSHLLQPGLTQLELPELQMCHSCTQVGLQQRGTRRNSPQAVSALKHGAAVPLRPCM